MEFWKIYRLVKARRWMILGLLLITLLTVFITKKALDENTQYVAQAIVLPSTEAMSSGGFYSANKAGELSPTYDRYSRIAQFLQKIKTRLDDAVAEAAQPAVEQKRFLVKSLSSQLTPELVSDLTQRQGKDKVKDVNKYLATAPDLDLNAILAYFHIPNDPSVWTPRSFTPAEQAQLKADLAATPYYDPSVNITPGSTTPTPVTTDDLIIEMRAAKPETALQIANLIAAEFINGYKQDGLDEFNADITNARKNQADAKIALNKAEGAYYEFKKQTPMVELSTTANSYLSNLQSLERQRDQAKTALAVATAAASSYTQLATAAKPSIVTILDPRARPEYQRLQNQVAQDQEALETLGTDLTPDNPRYQKAKSHMEADQHELKTMGTQKYINAQVNPEFQAMLAQANASKARAAQEQQAVESFDGQIAQQQQENLTLPDKERRLATLVEDKTTATEQKQVADANVAGLLRNQSSFNAGLISLQQAADTAIPDTSGPALAQLLIYGAILSLLIGITAAIGLDYLDNSVQTIPDAEKLLGMPVSAVIPAMPAGDPRRMTRLTVSDPLSPIAEAYRLLRTDLLFTAEDKPFQSLMAATAKPGQGATTTICNLAVALAAVGKRVILIDADLRRPKLHTFFSVSNETGLTSLLRDECEMEEALKVTDIDNLLVLPSGPLPLNPAELLASQKMRALHERLKPHTDFILVDTPSAIAFSDSSILASYLDAVMIVVRAQETPRGSEMQLKNLLNKARANVVGVVLNGVKPQLVDSYFYHAAYYPQITTANGHAILTGGNGGVLPPPANGKNGHERGNKTQERTLEGEGVGEALSGEDPEQDIESTVVMDDLVTVSPPKRRSLFNLRRRSDKDNRN